MKAVKTYLFILISIFIIEDVVAQNWGQYQKVVASDRGSNSNTFGQSVSVSGDYAIIGTK